MPIQQENPIDLSNCSFSQLTEVVLQLRNEGRKVEIEKLVELAPHLEFEIRKQLPAILMLEQAFEPTESETEILTEKVAGCVVKNVIGRGAMGVVYRAYQAELDREVAIKVIQTSDEFSNHSDRFELERRAMAKLDHPNIVPVYAFTQDNRHAYLVMKLVPGFGLNQLVEDGGDYRAKIQFAELKADWSQFARMAADVASGLHHAHEKGLIHRDIKPGNLMLDQDGKIWITDFGLAKMSDFARVISTTGDVVGTPRYMAPEQFQGTCDPRSDVYSLGMTLYQVAAGQCPPIRQWLPGQTKDSTVPSIEPIRTLNPDIPEDLAKVIMKACQFLPEDRYQSAHELEVVLRRFIDGRVADRRKKKRTTDAVFRRNFKLKMILCAVCSVIFSGGMTFLLTRSGQTPEQVDSLNQPPTLENVIERLADTTSNGKITETFGKSFRDSLSTATNEFNLPENERRELINELNVVYDQIKNGEFRHKELGALIDNYNDSNLAKATRSGVLRMSFKGPRWTSKKKRNP